jgi:hypothetical protein
VGEELLPEVLRGGRRSRESTGSTKTTAFQGSILGGADQADSCLAFVVPLLELILGDLATGEPTERHIRPLGGGHKIRYRLAVSCSSVSATRPQENAHAPGKSERTLSIAAMTSPAMAKREAIVEIWSRKVLRPWLV